MWFRRNKTSGAGEAEYALQDARKNLRKVQARSPEVSKIASALRDMRQRNHFAEQLEQIINPKGLSSNDI